MGGPPTPLSDDELRALAADPESLSAVKSKLLPEELQRLQQFQQPVDSTGGWAARYPKTAATVSGALNTLPVIGGAVGGMLSAPESAGFGMIPGVALGVGAGRGARDLAAEALGLEHSSPLAKAGHIARDTALTAATQGAVETGKAAVHAFGEQPLATAGELLRNLLSPRATLLRTAKDMMTTGTESPILSRPAWQTWTTAPAQLPKFRAIDVLRIRGLMEQGIPQDTAIRTVINLRAQVP